VKAGISTDRALGHDVSVAVQEAGVRAIFHQMETQIAIATETIAATISQPATFVSGASKDLNRALRKYSWFSELGLKPSRWPRWSMR
jgi:hypothetical protein